MSKKRTIYTTEFKTKMVLEILKNDKTINELSTTHNLLPKNLLNWKATFLANAEMAMEPAKAVKEYKDEILLKEQEIENLQKMVGKITIERDWLEGKLKSLASSSDRLALIDVKCETTITAITTNTEIAKTTKTISISRQCELAGVNRSNLYYEPKENIKKQSILEHINTIYELYPSYGHLKVHQQLLEDGFFISDNTVAKYRQEQGLRAILAVKYLSTTLPNKEHKKYPYLLRKIEITKANQVWSTDITYIKTRGGFVYLAAILDWYSKAILSYRISNTMDTTLVTDVLNDALNKYGLPEIFNTDQGSQYTSSAHIELLEKNNIKISMDGKGRATDNIAIERFWRSAKCEMIYLNEYLEIKDLKNDIKEYIEFYNNKRFHQSLDYKKPMGVYYASLEKHSENYSNLEEKAA